MRFGTLGRPPLTLPACGGSPPSPAWRARAMAARGCSARRCRELRGALGIMTCLMRSPRHARRRQPAIRSCPRPCRPVDGWANGTIEQGRENCRTVFQTFHSPAQSPGRPGGDSANGTGEQGRENCCTVFQTFHSPAPKPRSPWRRQRRWNN
jgi:hypothetical protein